MVKKYSNIKIIVGLDENNVPEKLEWEAEDNPEGVGAQECKAILLSLFDAVHKDTLKIDLWVKDMQMVEMDRFFYQTLRGLCDTYVRATNNKDLANEMRKFVDYFGQKTEITPNE